MYSKFYQRDMMIGDCNAEESEPCLSQFLFEMNPKNIVKEPTCQKRLSNPSCIDLVITNSSSSFQNTKAISTGLSDFHKMIITVLKQTFQRSSPKELVCRDYTNSDRLTFKRELEKKLNQKINDIRSLGIKANEYSHENYDLKNPAEIVIKKFEQHSRTNLIDKNITNNENLPADHENILKEIINLDYKKMKHLKTFLPAASRMVRCVLSCPRKYL